MLWLLWKRNQGVECAYQSILDLKSRLYEGAILTFIQTSLPFLSAKPNAPKFAILDCEAQPVLCNAWAVGPPSLYYFQIPKPLADQSAPAPTVRYVSLNRTSTTVDTIKTLVLDEGLEKTEPYEGLWHPFNGKLQEFGLAIPVGYAVWGFAKMPSWLPMILISVLSRSFM